MSEPSGRELDKALHKLLFGYSSIERNYSGADWQLVAEAMRQKGWNYVIDAGTDDFSAKWLTEIYEVVFSKRDEYGGDPIEEYSAESDTLGAAVGLAAYRALRAEEEGQ